MGKQRQEQRQGSQGLSGQRRAMNTYAEGGGNTVLQVFGARSCFSHKEKETHKGRLAEAKDVSHT